MFAFVSDRPNAGVIYESCQSSDGPVIFTGHSRNIWIDFVANKNSSGRGFQMSFLTIEGKKQSGCSRICKKCNLWKLLNYLLFYALRHLVLNSKVSCNVLDICPMILISISFMAISTVNIYYIWMQCY